MSYLSKTLTGNVNAIVAIPVKVPIMRNGLTFNRDLNANFASALVSFISLVSGNKYY